MEWISTLQAATFLGAVATKILYWRLDVQNGHQVGDLRQ